MHTEQPYFQSQPQNFAGPNSRTVAVIGNQFCASYPTELTIQKKVISFSGGDFNILDSNGNLFLAVDGRALSLRGTRILRDQYGNLLATMKKKLLSLHYTWEAYRGEGTRPENLIFTARRSTLQLRTSLKVYLGNNAHADFKVKGSFFERSCTIYQGTTVIAEMRRKYTVSQVLMGRDTFTVTVYPGVDYAFIVALVVILDEINQGGADAGADAAAAAGAAATAGAAAAIAAAAPPAPCI